VRSPRKMRWLEERHHRIYSRCCCTKSRHIYKDVQILCLHCSRLSHAPPELEGPSFKMSQRLSYIVLETRTCALPFLFSSRTEHQKSSSPTGLVRHPASGICRRAWNNFIGRLSLQVATRTCLPRCTGDLDFLMSSSHKMEFRVHRT